MPTPSGLSPSSIAHAISPAFAVDPAVPLDVRWPADFAAGHVPGSVHLTFNPSDLAERVASLLPQGLTLVVVGETDANAAAACGALADAGLPSLGWLAGGFPAWERAGLEVSRLPAIDVTALRDQLDRYSVVDVREPFEYERGHIEGAALAPSRMFGIGDLPDVSALTDGSGRRTAVLCAVGPRATFAASVLAREGVEVTLVLGGMNEWAALGYPVVTS